ncbi:hypothetical protein QBC39DRAFT_382031 [Podospora conica]|nr:hypothetical protein QBC39DRAFT_382031 [Schizothecium conicum]
MSRLPTIANSLKSTLTPTKMSPPLPTLTTLYATSRLSPPSPTATPPPTLLGPSTLPTPSATLNNTIALLQADITTLPVDAIVNAANTSLLGGGGVDGAIHRAAGPQLLAACRRLDGCSTGSAKITDAYGRLPCNKVIHAVGPVYRRGDREGSERALAGAYTRSLELAVEAGCRTVAFSALSTGVYGYPAREAAAVQCAAIRKFLEEGRGKGLEKVVLVNWMAEEVWRSYLAIVPLFFPPVVEGQEAAANGKEEETEEAEAKTNGKDKKEDDSGDESWEEVEKSEIELEAEAEEVAQKLPDPPTSDPAKVEEEKKKGE